MTPCLKPGYSCFAYSVRWHQGKQYWIQSMSPFGRRMLTLAASTSYVE